MRLDELAVLETVGARELGCDASPASGAPHLPDEADYNPLSAFVRDLHLSDAVLTHVGGKSSELPHDRIASLERSGLRPALRPGNPTGGIPEPGQRVEVLGFELAKARPHDLDVLLRHRPRSIPRRVRAVGRISRRQAPSRIADLGRRTEAGRPTKRLVHAGCRASGAYPAHRGVHGGAACLLPQP